MLIGKAKTASAFLLAGILSFGGFYSIQAQDMESGIVVEGNTVYLNGVSALIKKEGDTAYIYNGDGTQKLSEDPVGASTTLYGGGKNKAVVGDVSITVEDVRLSHIYGGGYSDGTGNATVKGNVSVTVEGSVVANVTGGGKSLGDKAEAIANVEGDITLNIPSLVPKPGTGFTQEGHTLTGGGEARAKDFDAQAGTGSVTVITTGPVNTIRGGGSAAASAQTANAYANTGDISVIVHDADVREIYGGGYADGANARAKANNVSIRCNNIEVMILRGGGYASGGEAGVSEDVSITLEDCPNIYGSLNGGGYAYGGGSANVTNTRIMMKNSAAPASDGIFGVAAAFMYGGGEAGGEGSSANVTESVLFQIENSVVAGAVFGAGEASTGGSANAGEVKISLDGVRKDSNFDAAASVLTGGQYDKNVLSEAEAKTSAELTVKNSTIADLCGGGLGNGLAPSKKANGKLSYFSGNTEIGTVTFFKTIELYAPLVFEDFEPAGKNEKTEIVLRGDGWNLEDTVVTMTGGSPSPDMFELKNGTLSYEEGIWAVKELNHAVSASASKGGAIEPSGDILIPHGESQLFTITPEEGFKINNFYVDGKLTVLSGNTYFLENVTDGHTIEVSFKADEAQNGGSSSNSSSGGSSGGSSGKRVESDKSGQTGENISVQPKAKQEGGKTETVLTGSEGNKMVSEALKNGSSVITIAPKTRGDVTSAEVSLTGDTLRSIGDKTEASLSISTPVAEVLVPNQTIMEISSKGSGIFSVKAEAEEGGNTSIVVKSSGEETKDLKNPLYVSLPTGLTTNGAVAVLVESDGSESVITDSVLSEGKIEFPLNGSATVKIVDNSKPFSDIDGHWAKDAVDFVSARGLFSGVSETSFAPNEPLTRGMAVAILGRMAAAVPSQDASGFQDVSPESYYSGYIAWAQREGIIHGVAEGIFAPDQNITKEQMAVAAMQYLNQNHIEVKLPDTQYQEYGEDVSDYAREAVEALYGTGIMTNGAGGSIISGGEPATRAEAAVMAENIMKLQLKNDMDI